MEKQKYIRLDIKATGEAIGEGLKRNGRKFAEEYYQGGQWIDNQNYRVADLNGGHGKSATFNLEKGILKDFATGETEYPINTIKRVHNLKYIEALKFANDWLGGGYLIEEHQTELQQSHNTKDHNMSETQAPIQAQEPKQENPEEEKKRKRAIAIFMSAKPVKDTIAEKYLQNRNIPFSNYATLRFSSSCAVYLNDKDLENEGFKQKLKSYNQANNKKDNNRYVNVPTLIATVNDDNGRTLAIQRIHLTEKGAKLGLLSGDKRTLGTLNGHGVWLGKTKTSNLETILVAEGLETALSLKSSYKGVAIATLGSSNMKHIKLPQETKKVIIAVDNDKAGYKTAFSLANRLQSENITPVFALSVNNDFNDDLQAFGKDSIDNALKNIKSFEDMNFNKFEILQELKTTPINIEEPIPSIDTEPNTIEEPIASIDTEPNTIEEPIASIDTEPNIIEEPIASIDTEPNTIEEPIASMDTDPNTIEEPVASIDTEPNTIEEPVASIDTEPNTIEEPVASIDTEPNIIEEPIASIDTEPNTIEEPVASIDTEPNDIDYSEYYNSMEENFFDMDSIQEFNELEEPPQAPPQQAEPQPPQIEPELTQEQAIHQQREQNIQDFEDNKLQEANNLIEFLEEQQILLIDTDEEYLYQQNQIRLTNVIIYKEYKDQEQSHSNSQSYDDFINSYMDTIEPTKANLKIIKQIENVKKLVSKDMENMQSDPHKFRHAYMFGSKDKNGFIKNQTSKEIKKVMTGLSIKLSLKSYKLYNNKPTADELKLASIITNIRDTFEDAQKVFKLNHLDTVMVKQIKDNLKTVSNKKQSNNVDKSKDQPTKLHNNNDMDI